MVKQLSGLSDQEHVGYYTGLMSAAVGIGLLVGGEYKLGAPSKSNPCEKVTLYHDA